MYITLPQASEHLRVKGLTGQTVSVLRSAIAGARLQAVKDGRCWKTTIDKLDAYEQLLWRVGKRTPVVVTHTESATRWKRRQPQNEAYEKARYDASALWVLNMLDRDSAERSAKKRAERLRLDAEYKAQREAARAARKKK